MKDDKSFNNHAVNNSGLPPLRASIPTNAQQASLDPDVRHLYYLHQPDVDPSVLIGSAVVRVDGLCPPFQPTENGNLFGHYFAVEFVHDGHTYVRAISPFEFVSCFCLFNELTYELSHPCNACCMDANIPSRTLTQILDQVMDQCVCICECNVEIFEPRQYAAPAACAQAFLNGAIGVQLPTQLQWVAAYCNNPTMSSILGFIQNPGTITNKNLEDSKLDSNYRAALRLLQIALKDSLLIYHEPIAGSESYARLQLVPAQYRNVVFVAFHTNPIGGHLNALQTFHRIWLRFYWPGMYAYITRMCSVCPGCALANPTRAKSRELVYNFPINFLTQKHAKLTSAPGTVELYSCKLATRLDACRKVAMLLVHEHCAWHQELVNSCR